MIWENSELSAAELLAIWTDEQQRQIKEQFDQMHAIGAYENGFTVISKLVMGGTYKLAYPVVTDII